jgi:predicted amidohydrolase YtcJ
VSLRNVIAGLLALACQMALLAQPGAVADVALLNGKIVTADRRFSIAQAVAIRDGKFLAVGSTAQIEGLSGPNTVRMDLGGRTVLPGLIDTHAHIAAAGNGEVTVALGGVATVAQALEQIRAWVMKSKPGDWIIGSGWHPPSQLKERRYLTRREIDSVAPDNPVYLPTVGHFAMANSKALGLAGITKATKDPPGGIIDREASGEPDGILEESAIGLLTAKIPPASPAQRAARLKIAMRVFNSYGITSAVDGGSGPAEFSVYEDLWNNHEMTLRTSIMYMPASAATTSLEVWEKIFRGMAGSSGFGDDWLRFAGIGELGVDGGMTLKTAFLREPYPDEPDNRGFETIPGEKLNQLAAICNRYGWRVGLHAVGDAAIDKVLDAYEYANREIPITGKRFVIIHGSLMREDQLKRAAKLGVRVDMQNVFMWDKADTVARFIGKERANRAVPTRLMIDTLGIENVGAGTDFSVNTLNPFINFYIMITRKDPKGTVYGKDQAITREEALRLYTSSAAGYNFEESKKGTIEPGKLADLVVLSDDLLTVREDRIKDIQAVTTMVDGKVVYQR